MTQHLVLPLYPFPLHYLSCSVIYQTLQENIDQTPVHEAFIEQGVDSFCFSVGGSCFPDGHEHCSTSLHIVIMGLTLSRSFRQVDAGCSDPLYDLCDVTGKVIRI